MLVYAQARLIPLRRSKSSLAADTLADDQQHSIQYRCEAINVEFELKLTVKISPSGFSQVSLGRPRIERKKIGKEPVLNDAMKS